MMNRFGYRLGRRGARRGFTLIEAALVTIIVGVAGVATMELLAAGTVANGESHWRRPAMLAPGRGVACR